MTQEHRIALLHPCFWPEVRRGSERMLNDLATGLASAGDRPTLITSHLQPAARSRERGYDVLRLRRPRGRRFQVGLRSEYLTHVPGVYRALRAEPFDIAHAAYPSDALAAQLWSRRIAAPHVFSAMGMPNSLTRKRRLWFSLQSRAVLHADVVTALSSAAAERVRALFGRDDVRVIQPGVDLDRFAPGPARAETPTIFCAAAVDDPRKRVRLLVEAFALLRRQHPQASLLLSAPSGRGGGRPHVEPAPGVELVDLRSDEAVVDCYRRAWVSVLPSVDEAFGLVLVESLACGTPVVASSHGALPEVIGNAEVGCLFDGDEPITLARSLTEAMALAEDPRVAAACRRRASDFSLQRMTSSYRDLYRELLQR